jgi:hypothetical protein
MELVRLFEQCESLVEASRASESEAALSHEARLELDVTTDRREPKRLVEARLGVDELALATLDPRP